MCLKTKPNSLRHLRDLKYTFPLHAHFLCTLNYPLNLCVAICNAFMLPDVNSKTERHEISFVWIEIDLCELKLEEEVSPLSHSWPCRTDPSSTNVLAARARSCSNFWEKKKKKLALFSRRQAFVKVRS